MATNNPLYAVTLEDGTELAFHSHEQVATWAKQEIAAWEPYYKKIANTSSSFPFNKQNFVNGINSFQLQPLRDLLDATSVNSDIGASNHPVSKQLRRLRDLGYVVSYSPPGSAALTAADENLYRSTVFIAASNPQIFPFHHMMYQVANSNNPNDQRAFNQYFFGLVEAKLISEGLRGRAEGEKRALAKIKSDGTKLIADFDNRLTKADIDYSEKRKQLVELNENIEKSLAKILEEANRDANAMRDETRNELEKVKKLYKEELALQVPVTYWTKKAFWHSIGLAFWSFAFVVLVGLILAFTPKAFEYAIGTLNALFPKDKPEESLLFFALFFPTFLCIWVLRLISRTLISHQVQMNDARLRSVMTNTFLALMSEGKATDNDRILILNALFHVPSTSNEDGSPPHWFEILQERMKAK